MKKFLITSLLSVLFLTVSSAQDCETYFPFSEGTEWTVTNYNKKGKEQGSVSFEVLSLKQDGAQTVGQYAAELVSGKETYDYDFTATCDGGALTIDMFAIYRNMAMEGMSGTEFEITTDEVQLPNPVADGTQLPDLNMKVSSVGMPVAISVEVTQTDRKVVAHESLTTPAGTYDCVKLNYTTKVKAMIVKRTMQITEWHAPGVGIVRSETYNKGKLIGYSELTAFSD